MEISKRKQNFKSLNRSRKFPEILKITLEKENNSNCWIESRKEYFRTISLRVSLNYVSYRSTLHTKSISLSSSMAKRRRRTTTLQLRSVVLVVLNSIKKWQGGGGKSSVQRITTDNPIDTSKNNH